MRSPRAGIVAGTHALDLDVVVGAAAVGGVVGGEVGDVQQQVAGARRDVLRDIGECLLSLAQLAADDLLRLGLIGSSVAAEEPDLLGDGVDLGADLVALGGDLTQLDVEFMDLFEFGEATAAAGQRGTDGVVVGSDSANVNHGSEPYSPAR